MRHFVAYHNVEGMGRKYTPSKSSAGFSSRKSYSHLKSALGHKVWIITGEQDRTRKKQYHLVGCFVPSKVKVSSNPDFDYDISGEKPTLCTKPVHLNDYDWFQELKALQGNFGFGINEISQPHIIEKLEKLAAANNKGK